MESPCPDYYRTRGDRPTILLDDLALRCRVPNEGILDRATAHPHLFSANPEAGDRYSRPTKPDRIHNHKTLATYGDSHR